ncbi:uncharacterized protein RCC_00638 [Ramularia collo-cygni]|uniref:Elongin-A n=1 Tax=Ramularia collo-cygni TaxID=112498 RepID=A0A2D3UX33_9PEZI|nr:uncharacterized protein RCC_00638 [Ramularia collo-cygni]CZT14664.1 uncharacterized protein RCC_00638 [Ramularia collo-cygni]
MAARTAARNITDIVDFGTMPYEVAVNVLRGIKNPAQLREIEENCPHIADSDAELWKAFIARDIPNWEAKMIYPQNPRSWWKVYRKLMREEELIEAAQEEALRKQLAKDTIKKSEQSTTYVPQVVSFAATVTDSRIHPQAHTRAADSGSRWSKKTKSGGRIVSAILRQTAEAHKTRQPFQPTHAGSSLAAAKRQISHAPAAMIPGAQRVQPRALLPHQEALLEEHHRHRSDICAPTSRVKKSTTISDALAQKRAINEKKLRELTNSKPAPDPKVEFRPKFELTTSRVAQQNHSKTEGGTKARVETVKTSVTPKGKSTEARSMRSPAPIAKSASPQPTPTAQQPAPVKRKRPATTNIFMTKKQKK